MNAFRRLVQAVTPRTISARGVLVVFLAAGAVAGPGLVAWYAVAARDRERHQYALEALLSATLTTYLESAPATAAEHGEWLERLEQRGLDVRWAGVVSPDGRGLEFRRRSALSQEEILAQIDRSATRPGSRMLRLDGRESQRFELVTLPRPEEGVVLAFVLDRGVPERDLTGAVVTGLAGLAVVGVLGALALLRRGVDGPIDALRRKLLALQAGLAEANAGGAMPTELAGLARAVRELHEELERSRVEAAYWKNAVDSEVEARTHRAARAQHQAERVAETDPLTRLANRRVLERELPRLFGEQVQARRELAVVMLDIDRFKQLNDTRGHHAGDELLAFVGDLVRATTRKGLDVAARYGGDEFVLVLPETTAAEAAEIARRIVTLFAQHVKTLGVFGTAPGLSAGVASLGQQRPDSWQRLLALADEAMYRAKHAGGGVAGADAPRAARSAPPSASS